MKKTSFIAIINYNLQPFLFAQASVLPEYQVLV